MSCVVEVENLSYSYPDGHSALHDVTFSLGHGEKVALVGPNGAGKSTLLLHLNGILPCQSGSLRISEMEVTSARTCRVSAPWSGWSSNPPTTSSSLPPSSTTSLSARSTRVTARQEVTPAALRKPWRWST